MADVFIPTTWCRATQVQIDWVQSKLAVYESKRTGMRAVVIDRKGPRITGEFAVATEIFDNSGAPHTLEHLVFMGSKSYPYKGLLDKVASLSNSKTNAYTMVDRTCYTLDSAGWEGFAQVLPMYLEHVLLPTVTDAACTTEVWHIDGEGNDSGVVYSEMQALQYRPDELMDTEARRILYPEGCGFRYETGGLPSELRKLTNDRIRQFHRDMYQPRNLCLVISGDVDHSNMLQILEKFEEGTAHLMPSPDSAWKRPWYDSESPPALTKTVVTTVDFPEDDESVGEIMICFVGPSCMDNLASTAVDILLSYLADSSASVLENMLVHKEQLASSVSYSIDIYSHTLIQFFLRGVATEKLHEVERRFMEILKTEVSKPLDMEFLESRLMRDKRDTIYRGEQSINFLQDYVICDFLYGSRSFHHLEEASSLAEYDELRKWTEEQWRDFLKNWIAEAPHVSILGKPSQKMAEEVKKAEEERVAKRKEELGPEKLQELQKKLDGAVQESERKIPDEILNQYSVPSAESIHLLSTQQARAGNARSLGVGNNKAQEIVDRDTYAPDRKFPFLHFEHYPSNFVRIRLYINTQTVPIHLRPLMPVLCDVFFSSALVRNGKKVPFEDVVRELETDTVDYFFDMLTRENVSAEMAVFALTCEASKYVTAIEWVRELLFNRVLDEERIQSCIAKLVSELPQSRRSGHYIGYEVLNKLHTDSKATVMAASILTRNLYLRRLKKRFAANVEEVLGWLAELQKSMFRWENVRIAVYGDVEKLDNVVDAWEPVAEALQSASSSLPSAKSQETVLPIMKPENILTQDGREPGVRGASIVPMIPVDGSFAFTAAKGFLDPKDPVLPAVFVAVSYLQLVEGPLWNAVRGKGLAYGTYFSNSVTLGYLYYSVYRSPDSSKALVASRDAIQRIVNGTDEVTKTLMEGAVSQLVTKIAFEQGTYGHVADKHFSLTVLQDLPVDWPQKMLGRVRNVTVDEMREAMRTVILPLFEPGKSNVVVTCNPLLVGTMESSFRELGYETHVRSISDFEDDFGLAVPENDDGEDEEEEEDDENSEESDASEE